MSNSLQMSDVLVLNDMKLMSGKRKAELIKSFCIFKKGVFSTSKGDFLYDDESERLVMEAYNDQGVDLFFDLDHGTFKDSGPVDKGKAFGWFQLEAKPDGLYAVNVTWTDMGKQLLSDRAFRYYSPAIQTSAEPDPETGLCRVTELLNIALTNLPATKKIEPLAANRAMKREQMSEKENKTLAEAPVTEDAPAEETKKLAEIMDDDIQAMLTAMDEILALQEDPTRAPEEKLQLTMDIVSRLRDSLQMVLDDPQSQDTPAEDAAGAAAAPAPTTQSSVDLTEQLTKLNISVPAGEDTVTYLMSRAKKADELERVELSRQKEELITQLLSQMKLAPAQKKWAETQSIDQLKMFSETASRIVPEDFEEAARNTGSSVVITEKHRELARTAGLKTEESIKAYVERLNQLQSV